MPNIRISDAPQVPELSNDTRIPVDRLNGKAESASVQQINEYAFDQATPFFASASDAVGLRHKIESQPIADISDLTDTIPVPDGFLEAAKRAAIIPESATAFTRELAESITSLPADGSTSFFASLTDFSWLQYLTNLTTFARSSMLIDEDVPSGHVITIPASVSSIPTSTFRTGSIHLVIMSPKVCSPNYSSSSCLNVRFSYTVKQLTIGSGVSTIGNNMMYNASQLEQLSLPESLHAIGSYAFYGCNSLTRVIIPANVSAIGGSSFNYCHALTDIYILNPIPSTLGSSAFPSGVKIHIPAGTRSYYEQATNWNQYSSSFVEEDYSKISLKLPFPEPIVTASVLRQYLAMQDAPSDGKLYARGDGSWKEFILPENTSWSDIVVLDNEPVYVTKIGYIAGGVDKSVGDNAKFFLFDKTLYKNLSPYSDSSWKVEFHVILGETPDATLSIQGRSADAKAVGDQLSATVRTINNSTPDSHGNINVSTMTDSERAQLSKALELESTVSELEGAVVYYDDTEVEVQDIDADFQEIFNNEASRQKTFSDNEASRNEAVATMTQQVKSAETAANAAASSASTAESSASEAQKSAQSAAEKASSAATSLNTLQEAIKNLPDGQAVSAQVATNTAKLSELEGQINGEDYWEDLTDTVTFVDKKNVDGRPKYNYTTVNSNSFKSTDFIQVIAGTTIQIVIANRTSSTSFEGWGTYDADKNPINTGNHYIGNNTTEPYGINVLRTIEIPEGVYFIRASYIKADESTPFKYLAPSKTNGLAGDVAEMQDTINETSSNLQSLSKDVDIIEQKVSQKVVNVSLDEHTIEDIDTDYFYMWFELPFELADKTTITFGRAISYCEGIYTFDKFGNYLSRSAYASSLDSFLANKSAKRVRIKLRKQYYNFESKIIINYSSTRKDVFDEPLLISNAVVENDGKTNYHVNVYSITYRTPIEPNTKYVMQTEFYPNPANSGINIAFYDKDGNMLGVVASDAGTTRYFSSKNYNGYKFETPDNATYAYLLVNNTTCERYDYPVYIEKYYDINIKPTKKGVTIWVLGDSISATGYNTVTKPWQYKYGIGGWLGRFLQSTDVRVENIYNYSEGGYTLSDSSADGVSANSYIKKLEQAIVDYDSGIIGAPDIIMIVGCTNDVGQDRVITNAEISASPYSSYEEYVERTFFTDRGDYYHKGLLPLPSINKGKIIGAMRYIVERSGTLFPNLKWFATTLPQSSRKNAVDELACRKDMMFAANRLGIPIADVWGEANMPMLWDYNSNWNETTENHRFLTDGIHTFYGGGSPQVTGYIRQGEYIARKFSECFKYDLLEGNR